MRDRKNRKLPLSEEARREIMERLSKRHSRLTPEEREELALVFPYIVAEHDKQVGDRLHGRGLSDPEKEDTRQEIFLGLFRDSCEHGIRDNIESLLEVIIRRRRVDRVRVHARAPETVPYPSSTSEKPTSGQLDVDGAVDRRDLERRARERLSPEQWAAFEQIVLQGRTYPEAEALLNAPENTLRSRVARAKRVFLELAQESPPSDEGGAGRDGGDE